MIDITRLSSSELERFIHLQSIVDRQQDKQSTVRAMRDYYYGNHPVLLTQRQKEYLGALVNPDEFTFCHNLVRTIVDTLRERLSVTGFTVNGRTADDINEEQSNTEDGNASHAAAIMWQWWNDNRMDSQQIRLHRRTIRDGKSYAIVDYDNENQRPRITLHKADDGKVGVTYHRDPSDQNRVLFAARYFYTYDPLTPNSTGYERKTVYLPYEIRKYIRRIGMLDWQPYYGEDFNEQGESIWPIPWRDNEGRPLGVPVIEFENPGGSEIVNLIGLQNAVNKSWLDVLAGEDASGFPLLVAEYDPMVGLPPDEDDDDLQGSNENRIGPGRMFEIVGHLHRIEGASLAPMIEVVWALVQAMSGASRTPSYYLKPVGGSDVPSGESLKQLDSGLVMRAEERQLMFGQSWADVMMMAVKVDQTFGTEDIPQLAHWDIATQWSDPNVRNELAQAQAAQIYKSLGVPDEEVWATMGFEPEKIAQFKNLSRVQRMAEIASIAEALKVQQQTNAPQTNPATFPNGNGA